MKRPLQKGCFTAELQSTRRNNQGRTLRSLRVLYAVCFLVHSMKSFVPIRSHSCSFVFTRAHSLTFVPIRVHPSIRAHSLAFVLIRVHRHTETAAPHVSVYLQKNWSASRKKIGDVKEGAEADLPVLRAVGQTDRQRFAGVSVVEAEAHPPASCVQF